MKFTDIFKFKLFERTDPVDMKTVNENFESVEKLFKGLDQVDNTSDCDKNVASAKKAECDGNGKNISETYLKKTAVANNNTTTEAGFALDARQANPNVDGSLAKQISVLNDGLASHKSASDHDNRYYTKAQIDSKNDVFTKKINEYNIDAATEANNLTWLVVLDGVTLKHREMRTLHVDKADYLSSFWASDGAPHKISFGFDSASWNVIVYVDGVQIGKIVN